MIAVLDYGLGNPLAIVTMLRHIGVSARTIAQADGLGAADKLILPGVGAFDRGMELLDERGLRDPLDRFAESGRPILGICLGMQLMTRRSDEGAKPGLGWIATETTAFASDPACAGLRIPHMAWSTVEVLQESALFERRDGQRFWFVHSYRIATPGDAAVLATCHYGSPFIAAFRLGNLFGVQFHPEKSHRHGMTLLRAFAGIPTP